MKKYTLINPKTNIKWLATITDKYDNINAELPTSEWELNFSEQNARPSRFFSGELVGRGITKVSISVYFESLEELKKMLEMGFKEGFTVTLNQLTNLLKTLKNRK